MSNTVFYSAVIAFSSGIFIRSFFEVGFIEIIFLVSISFVCAVVWRVRSGQYTSPFFLISLMLICGALGILRIELYSENNSYLNTIVDQSIVYEGIVIREPDIRNVTQHLYIQSPETRSVILVTTDVYQDIRYGDRVRVSGVLGVPASFETDLGRIFNYPGYLKARGVDHTISFAEVAVLERDEGNIFIASLLIAKEKFMQTIETILPEPHVGLGEGVLLGVKRALGNDLEEAFRRTGIIHIVVLSGYNVMLVAEGIMRLLSYFFVPKIRLVLGVIAITAFALLVGLGATVVRASIMAVLVLVARATGRTYAIMRALMLAGIMMLLINPYLLAYDPGFQLSFLATLGLVLLPQLLETHFGLIPTTFQIREFFLATLSTQIFVLPLLLYLMGELSIVSVLVNVLVLPMVPIAMLLTFLAGVIGMVIPILGTLMGYGAHISLGYILVVAEFFAQFSFATFSVPTFPFWMVIIAYVGLGVLIYRLRKPKPNVLETVDHTDDLDEWTIEEEVEQSAFPFR